MIKYDLGNVKAYFTTCECQTELLYIEYDDRLKIADVALYEHRAYLTGRMSFWQRLRYCWKILCTGRPYSDQLSLGSKSLKELKVFLSSLNL